MASHSSIIVWKIPWTEEPGGLQSTGLERIGHDWAHTYLHTHTHTHSVEITVVKMRADTYYNCNYTIAVTILPGKNFFPDIRLCEFPIHRYWGTCNAKISFL